MQVGINDLQFQYNVDLNVFESKLIELIGLIKTDTDVILLCPNVINECILSSYFSQLFDKSSIEKSKRLPEIYKKVSDKMKCKFVDLNNFAEVSKIDGIHYNAQNHEIIANVLFKILN